MANHEDTIRRWRQVIEGTTTKSFLKNYNIVSGHDGIYSYGRHFPLAIPLRQDGTLVGYLLNGDVYSVSTSRHQREVRSVLEGHDLPTITGSSHGTCGSWTPRPPRSSRSSGW
jgi:hypothetical protein